MKGTLACVSPIDGGWSDWSSWLPAVDTECSGTTFTQTRTRTCTNPAPANDGADCEGDGTETKEVSGTKHCPVIPTPVDGGWSDWSSWLPAADTQCSDVTFTQTRTRTCTNPAPAHGGDPCEGDSTETKEDVEGTKSCLLPVDGGWSTGLRGFLRQMPCVPILPLHRPEPEPVPTLLLLMAVRRVMVMVLKPKR